MIEGYSKGEVRPRRVFKLILIPSISILILMLLIKVSYRIDKSNILPIKKVQISGNSLVSNREVLKIIELENESSILFFSKNRAKKLLLEDQRVKVVEMVKIYPDTLRIHLVEEEPVVFIHTSGSDYWLSKDGIVLAERIKASDSSLPSITINLNNVDIKIGKKVDDFMVKSILQSLSALKGSYPNFYNLIDSFSVDERGIYLWVENRFYQVYLGDQISLDKLERLRALIMVLKSLYPEKGIGTLKIDMSFSPASVSEGD